MYKLNIFIGSIIPIMDSVVSGYFSWRNYFELLRLTTVRKPLGITWIKKTQANAV